jgi:hypothetical protein
MEVNLFTKLLSLVPQSSKIDYQIDKSNQKKYGAVINDRLRVHYLLGDYDDLITVSYTNIYSDSSYIAFNLQSGTEIFGYECYNEGFMYYEFNNEDYYNGIFKTPCLTKENILDDMLAYKSSFREKYYIYIETLIVDQPIFEDFTVPWKFEKWLKTDGLCFVDHGPNVPYKDIFLNLIKWTEGKQNEKR